MAKITVEKEKCIGCGTCAAVCPKYFEIADDGKSHTVGGVINGAVSELQADQPECATQAAEACPVQCIRVEK